MPPRSAAAPPLQAGKARAQYSARLEQRLVLLRWMLEQFGYESNQALLEDCAEAGEGVDEGLFRVIRRLLGHAASDAFRRNLKR